MIEIKGRRFSHFNQETYEAVLAAGKDASPSKLGKKLGIDARRINDLQLWLCLRTPRSITTEVDALIRENLDLDYRELSKMTGISADTISSYMRARGLGKRKESSYFKISLEDQEAYEKDLKDPRLSHTYIGEKWGVRLENVGAARKRRGLGVWRTNHTTMIERKVANILEQLDFAYMGQRRINQWSLDFYLGQKTCIDVHGTYWHSGPEKKKRDDRKAEDLAKLGYKYLVIHEVELEDLDKVKDRIRTFCEASLLGNQQTKTS